MNYEKSIIDLEDSKCILKEKKSNKIDRFICLRILNNLFKNF